MFEDNKYIEQDNLFRSILEEGQEPVPAHVWEGVEADLNRIASRRLLMTRLRRTAAVIAAAAAVAVGLFLSIDNNGDIVNPAGTGDMIAIAEPQQEIAAEPSVLMSDHSTTDASRQTLIAQASVADSDVQKFYVISETPEADRTDFTPSETPEATEPVEKPEPKPSKSVSTERYAAVPFDEWPEEEGKVSRSRVRSITLSGLTGTNSTQNNLGVNPMRRPALSSTPKKTGIKETSTNSTYGIPVSFGIGARFDISKKWSVGTGVNYTLLSRKFSGTYTSADSKETDICSIRENQHYVGIPINFYYDIVNQKNINFYTYAGGAAEKCVSDKFQVLNTTITHTDKVKGVQLSANIGLGVEFMLGRHLGIYVDPSLRYYFNNYQPKSIRTVQPLMFGLEMGLRINL